MISSTHRAAILSSLVVLASSSLWAQTSTSLNDISFAPLREPTPIPLIPPYGWWIISLLSIALLAAIVIFIRSARKTAAIGGAKINPLNIALESIKALEKRIDELEAREFSSEVSEIVRRYIEQACEIPAQEQTTEEFMKFIQSHPFFSNEIKEPLNKFLALCDMAKFAQQSVNAEERKRLLKEAGLLVEKLYRFVVKRSTAESTTPPPLKKSVETEPVAT